MYNSFDSCSASPRQSCHTHTNRVRRCGCYRIDSTPQNTSAHPHPFRTTFGGNQPLRLLLQTIHDPRCQRHQLITSVQLFTPSHMAPVYRLSGFSPHFPSTAVWRITRPAQSIPWWVRKRFCDCMLSCTPLVICEKCGKGEASVGCLLCRRSLCDDCFDRHILEISADMDEGFAFARV